MSNAPAGSVLLRPAQPGPALFAALCAALLAVNPLTWALHKVSGGLFPDSLAYLALANTGISSGMLYLDGWRHVDAGLVLPPLLPALVAALSGLTGDPTATAYAICTASMLLATVPLLWLACRLGGPLPGFLAVAVVQASPLGLEFGASVLTEAPFVLLLATALCLLASHNDRPAAWKAVGLGVAAALLFFCRQIGGFFWPVAAALVALRALADVAPGSGRARAALAPVLLVTASFGALMVPYTIALHAQTGHGPLTQSFRKMEFVVRQPEGYVPPPSAVEGYYARRREQRALLPDGSEMIGWAPSASPGARKSLEQRLARIPRNAIANLKHVRNSLGTPGAALFVLTLFTPLLLRGRGPAQWARWLLPATLLAYLGGLSLFAGAIARYPQAIAPFAVLQILGEAGWLLRHLPARAPRPLGAGIAIVLAATLVATLPRKFWSVQLGPRIGESHNPLAQCRRHVAPGEPVYGFHPLGVYLLGGTYRVIPNDSLGRVVDYAARTGVQHMLVTALPFEIEEMTFYTNAPWLQQLGELHRHDPRIRAQCVTPDGLAMLYQFQAAAAERR